MAVMEFVWVGIAAVATAVLLRASRDALASPGLRRSNYAGRDVATSGGVVAIFGFLVAIGAWAALDYDGVNRQVTTAIVVTGFGAVGLFDDLVGTSLARGFRGHLRAAARGQLTSGATKLLVGVAVAVIATVPFAGDAEHRVLSVIVVAGAANAANLFDLAPGRLTKVGVGVAAVLTLAASSADAVLGPLMFVAAIVTLLPAEMDERLMLGDAGANALGGVVGLLALSATDRSRAGLWVAAGVVVAINVAGELVSFSRVIEKVPPLRMLDQLGRRR